MKKIPFNRPSLLGNELRYIENAVQLGQLAGDGYYTKKCQEQICDVTGSSKALITHSCTAALEMAAILCDLGPGDEVIMPSFTFVSTANAVVLRGATPVFVDICRETLNLDVGEVRRHITPRTRAIFAVHYAGFPAEMDTLMGIARDHDLLVVEDAAQAFGATYRGRPAGALGDMAAFSFHETKNVISGEGGALTINRASLVERAEIIREKGTNRSQFFRGAVDKYTWVDIGSSYLPGEVIAAFLCAQLEVEERIRNERLALFDAYCSVFAPVAQALSIELPKIPPGCVGNGHMFYLIMQSGEARDQFIKQMNAKGITTPFHYVPLHSAPAGRRFGRVSGDLPVTDAIAARLVRLPMFFELGRDMDCVITAVEDTLRALA